MTEYADEGLEKVLAIIEQQSIEEFSCIVSRVKTLVRDLIGPQSDDTIDSIVPFALLWIGRFFEKGQVWEVGKYTSILRKFFISLKYQSCVNPERYKIIFSDEMKRSIRISLCSTPEDMTIALRDTRHPDQIYDAVKVLRRLQTDFPEFLKNF